MPGSNAEEEGFDRLLGVSLDATSICNLRCTTCTLEDSYRDKGIMSAATFARLDDAFPRLKHLAFSSSAEPLLNPRLIEMLERAKRKSQGRIKTSFTTNGTFVDEAMLRELLRVELDALEFSFDANTKETFERIRIRASFDHVLSNIGRTLGIVRRLRGTTTHVSIRYTMFRDNVHELLPFIRRVYEFGADHVVVNGLEPYTEEMAQKILYGESPAPEMVALFTEIEAVANRLGMRVDLPRLEPDTIDACDLIDHSCILLWDGSVVPCSPVAYSRPYYYFGTRHQHDRVTFGNVNQTPLFDIWESPEYTQWRADVRGGTLYDYCKTCLKRAAVICPLRHWTWLKTRAAI